MLEHAGNLRLLSPKEQAVYAAAGGLAGLAIFPIELGFGAFSSTKPPFSSLLRSHASVQIPRAALRFWAFGMVKSMLSGNSPERSSPARTGVVGGVGGFAGGLTEVAYQAVVLNRRLPTLHALAPQSSKLFFCFGTFNFLTASLSDETPPRPFWKCWLLGAAAGATGSAILAAVSGARRNAFLTATGKGAVVIGTVISVQVSWCAATLERVGD